MTTTSNSGRRSSSARCCSACCSGGELARVAALGLLAADAEVEERRAERLDLLRRPPGGRRTPRRPRRAAARSRSPAGRRRRRRARARAPGAIVPAAVISIGNSFGHAVGGEQHAPCSPATVACDESASIDCARVMRGTDSIANATTPCVSQARDALGVGQRLRGSRSAPCRGAQRGDLVGAGPRDADDGVGAVEQARAVDERRRLPRRTRRRGSRQQRPRRARRRSRTPTPASFAAASGVSATRLSPGADSRGTHDAHLPESTGRDSASAPGTRRPRGRTRRLHDRDGGLRPDARRSCRARRRERRGRRAPARLGRGAARGAAARRGAPRRRQGQRPAGGAGEARTARRRASSPRSAPTRSRGMWLIAGVPSLQPALPYVLFHHERWDGRGYPTRRAGTDDPRRGPDARRRGRVRRDDLGSAVPPGAHPDGARGEIERCPGTQFDPDIVDGVPRRASTRARSCSGEAAVGRVAAFPAARYSDAQTSSFVPRAPDHLVGERRRAVMAAEVGGADALGDGLEAVASRIARPACWHSLVVRVREERRRRRGSSPSGSRRLSLRARGPCRGRPRPSAPSAGRRPRRRTRRAAIPSRRSSRRAGARDRRGCRRRD